MSQLGQAAEIANSSFRKFIPTILCACAALALLLRGGGFVEHAHGQGNSSNQTQGELRAIFSEPSTAVIYTKPMPPPKDVPNVPCATRDEEDDLLNYITLWRVTYNQIGRYESQIEDLENAIHTMNQVALSIINSGAASADQAAAVQLASLIGSVKQAKSELELFKEVLNNNLNALATWSNEYQKLLDSIAKDCPPPQSQAAPQPPQPPPSPPGGTGTPKSEKTTETKPGTEKGEKHPRKHVTKKSDRTHARRETETHRQTETNSGDGGFSIGIGIGGFGGHDRRGEGRSSDTGGAKN